MKLLGNRFARATLLACAALIIFSASALAADYEQNFDSFVDSGWKVFNQPDSPDAGSWGQGAPSPSSYWGSHSGAANSFVQDPSTYVSSSPAATKWLISPKFSTISNGDVVSFFMRMSWMRFSVYDPIDLRVSLDGECSPGVSDYGHFSKLLISPNMGTYRLPNAYPSWDPWHIIVPFWTEHAGVITGLPAGEHSGCFAIRHNRSYGPGLAVDDFSYRDNAASPGDIALLGPGPGDFVPEQIFLRGRADPGATVDLYLNQDCSGASARTVAVDGFEWAGIYMQLNGNAYNDISATSTDEQGNRSDCHRLVSGVFSDADRPLSSDDVGTPGRTYPGPVRLRAQDSGSGVAGIYFLDGTKYPWQPQLYDPGSPPILQPGQKLTYYSVDKAGNAEYQKTSVAAPFSRVHEPRVSKPAPGEGVVAKQVVEPSVRLAGQSLHLRDDRVFVRLVCTSESEAHPCRGLVTLTARLPGSKKSMAASLTSRYTIPGDGEATVKLRLTHRAQRRLSHLHADSIWSQVVAEDDGSVGPQKFRRKLFR